MRCSRRARRLYCAATRARSEGFGLGFVQGGDVLLRKRPRAETVEVDLYSLVKDTRAEALVGGSGWRPRRQHAAAEDADPFRFRSWLFGSIGELSGRAFEAVRERMLESTPAFLRRNIRGQSPSEHLFHLFLAFLHDAGIAGSADAARRRPCTSALRNSLAFVDGCSAAVGRAAAARSRWPRPTGAASSRPAARIRCATSSVEGISDCPVCQAKHARRRATAAAIPHEALRALVVEADRDVANAAPGWHDVPDRSALIAGSEPAAAKSSLDSDGARARARVAQAAADATTTTEAGVGGPRALAGSTRRSSG